MNARRRARQMQCTDRRNLGFGKHMQYAAEGAFRHKQGEGRHATMAAMVSHCGQFVEHCAQMGIRDWRAVDLAVLEDYAEQLAELVLDGVYEIASAQNLLSMVNTVLQALRGDSKVWISPSEWVGRRTTVRQECPDGMSIDQVMAAADELALLDPVYAALLELWRRFGLRFKEGCLLRIGEALLQAQKTGRIRVEWGTKGGCGHYIERYVASGTDAVAALERARALLKPGKVNLLGASSFIQFRRSFDRNAMPILKQSGIACPRELRAAYACTRYRELTGADAPVVMKAGGVSHETDLAARKIIAQELGHGRVAVVASYCGNHRYGR